MGASEIVTCFSSRGETTTTQPQIACQLIVYGARNREDLPGVLREIAPQQNRGIYDAP